MTLFRRQVVDQVGGQLSAPMVGADRRAEQGVTVCAHPMRVQAEKPFAALGKAPGSG